ncbi:26S proteasome regulatory subunit 6A, partial [Gonapodya sp. JEL0774]
MNRLSHETASQKERIKDNKEKIKLNKQLPYLVSNVVEIMDMAPDEEEEEEGGNVDLDEQRKGKCAVIKTSTRQVSPQYPLTEYRLGRERRVLVTLPARLRLEALSAGSPAVIILVTGPTKTFRLTILDDDCEDECRRQFVGDGTLVALFLGIPMRNALVDSRRLCQTVFLPMVGLVDVNTLKPGDLIGVNKDSYLILDALPAEYDSRVKAMEVDEKPTEDYNDIGGLDKQIEELVEAIVLPMTQAERFKNLGIRPPKGCLMYGPPGTGKTLLARACAAQTNATFLKLAGPQLVQMFIGDGAKLVRDAFALAKEKAPAIIFIDELDAIGTKRFDSDKSGDREVQRTMLELLNQLDGFSSDDRVKVIAATNRVDILDPALLRSGRLDRKIEFPAPNEEARARIVQIHSRKMTVNPNVNFDEIARSCDEFNGAQCKAICVEAGMLALRRGGTEVIHEDFME